MKYALITGGATGIGRGFANALSDIGYNLILTSRNLDNLAQAKKEIEKKYSNKVQIFICDLTLPEMRKKLFNYTSNYNVSVVINNAGIGYSSDFYSGDLEREKYLIELNLIALHDVFKHYYQIFYDQKSGRIINVSSLGSLFPGPNAATYFANKAYVTSLTRSVAIEARKQGVEVQVLCPGSTKTQFYKTAGTKPTSYRGNPNAVARKAVESKRVMIVPGFKAKAIHLLTKILPSALIGRIAYYRQRRKKVKE
ncbi:MAG: SDR family NAD(P)-dependent oxidoreductase [Acholeplasmataceae bacterium]|nr:SDR family NAD(P)-dependent oxidoreductase [Acholeplasmataceae bacterium]